jgi:hypothetical protein
MKQQQISPYNRSVTGFSLIPKPVAAWTAILALSFLTIVLISAGAGKLLNFAFPIMSLGVGAFLYFRYPILYNGFTWWIWFLVALVRRLADYYSSYTEPSPLLLAPYLVSGLTLITVFRYLPKIPVKETLPFILPLIGVFYGCLVGLINMSSFTVFKSLLDWLIPITYGFHLLVYWHNFPKFYQNIQRVFVWGILLMSIYGIIQFIAIPEWDRQWLNSSEMFTAAGLADESGGTRIWSTMHSGEPFAAFMAGGLLLLFNKTGLLNYSASGVGYIAFLLTTVRSAWIGWLAGLIALASSLKTKYQMRLIMIVIATAILVIPLAGMEQFSGQLGDRFATFSNFGQDASVTGRQELFKDEIGYALTNFVGDGIGTPAMDSALLSTLISLGWFGTTCYVSGLSMLIFRLFQANNSNYQLLLSGIRAIVISSVVRIPVNSSAIIGIGGIMLWGFFGLFVAFSKYNKHQKIIKLVSDR